MGRRYILALVVALTLGGGAHAGQRCDITPLTPQQARSALDLARRTADILERSGVQVALLGRAGQDLSAYGLRYSHVGIAYREQPDFGPARWRVLHKLNQCGTAHAGVYRQGLADFFFDQPHRYEAYIAFLDPTLQAQMLPGLRTATPLLRVHGPAYSMVAYAWSDRYQQSNQWVIETIAVLSDPTIGSRAQAQMWLLRHGYQPGTVQIPAAQRLAARLGTAHIAFDDHPAHLRYSGQIQTVTADSVFDWLHRTYPSTRSLEVRAGDPL